MKPIQVTLRYLVLAILACAGIPAQETGDRAASVPVAFEEALPIPVPIQVEGGQKGLRLELVVHRWSDRGSQDEGGQRFRVSVKERPPFLENIRWDQGPEIEFAPGEHSKILALIFDTTGAGATSQPVLEGKLVLRVETRHQAVMPPARELEITLRFQRALQPGRSSISVCALREDAPEDFPPERAFEFCDPNRQPVLRSDRVVLFFTPGRDLREPIGEDQYFLMRVMGPSGQQIAYKEFWNKGSADSPELSMPFTVDGSPGRFAIPFSLWNARDNPDPARGRTAPGIYTVQTVDAKIRGAAVLGQGEGRPMINGEWRNEGTFEIGDVRPRFAGFVAEDVNDLPLPSGAYTGALTVGKPQVSGSSVGIEMQARWRTRPDAPEQLAASRLSINFPAELRPDYEQVGSLATRLEVLEKSEHSFPLFFTAGIHRLVTTNKVPPDRHLVEGDAIPPLWKPLEHNMGSDCRGGSWVWTQGAGNPTYQAEPTEGQCTVRLELAGGYREAKFGDPVRGLASHLHDSATLWVIPVFYSLSEDAHPWSSGQKMNLRSYGYALYAAQPYTGPGPTGRPGGGDSTGAGVSGVVAGTPADTPSGTRTGEETGTTTGAGTGTTTGTATGTGSGTTAVAPPSPDPSNPAGLDPDRQPQVKDLVREWLAAAEPPENAVPGVEFRYDELGRKIGGGATGRVTGAHSTVDYGAGVSTEARVWSALRTQLDSIDHCTLEEYVIARLQDQSIAPCRGRYAAVRDLAGVPLAEARREVEGAGFEVRLAPGRPAPAPAANGTVERQDPRPTQHLKRGQGVTLVVHAPYVPPGILAPDLVNLTRSEAKEILENRGLMAALRPGSPARTSEQSDTIESQKPVAGTPLERGSEVVIWVRSPFVAARTVPNVLGLSIRDARAALAAAGLAEGSTILAPGGPAPTPALSGTVAAQEPVPGSTIAPETRVTLKVHSAFVELRTVPPVVGLTGEAARQQLAAAGLEVQTVTGSPARSSEGAGTVADQSPAAGSSVSAGTLVRISVYAPYLVVSPPDDRQTGWPRLECPASMPLGRATQGLPIGTRIPLDPASSGNLRNAQQAYQLFVCSYRRDNLFNEPLLHASWVRPDATGLLPPNYCQADSTNILGSHYLRSRSNMVEVQVFNRGLDWNQSLRVARDFISRIEPYARPCRGSVTPPPPPTPPGPPPPPPSPPTCPGPEASPIYDLWNPPPYSGLGGIVCQDGVGQLWINISNNVRPVSQIQLGTKDPNSNCWWGTKVVTPVHTYEGNLCKR